MFRGARLANDLSALPPRWRHGPSDRERTGALFMTVVLGVDAAAGQWLGVVLDAGRYADALLCPTVTELLAAFPDVAAVGIDIAIGLPVGRFRPADAAARRFVGPARAASVFPTFPEEVLFAASYADAREVARQLLGTRPSRQAWGLRSRIEEVARLARTDGRLVEVHPEVSFCAMKGAPLAFSKHTWSGLNERRALLWREGIRMPAELPKGGAAAPDDVLDAAAAAWSAGRVASGVAGSLPEVASDDPADGGVIRY